MGIKKEISRFQYYNLLKYAICIQQHNLKEKAKNKMKAHSATHQHDKKSIFEFLPGPIKIKDGLFIGDQIAARDIEFIVTNKVTHIINTVSGHVPNLWEKFGIHYLSVNWTEKQQNIFDKKNNAVNKIFHFVQQAMQLGESCLIHSVNSKSRACAVLVAYLMKKYSWSLSKCLQFVASKKDNLQIRNNYLLQMQELQQRMTQIYNLTSQWSYSNNQQQLVLRNTFANSKPLVAQKTQTNVSQKKAKKKVSWGEKTPVSKNSHDKNLTMVKQKTKNMAQKSLKSILKGDPGPEDQKLKQQQFEQLQQFESQKLASENKLINNINGNIVHVTVNNFITSEKKPQIQGKNSVNTRPYSSDQKDRQKQKRILNPKKNLPFDPNGLVSFKSPYDNKFNSSLRGGSHNKMLKNKQEKQPKNVVMTYQRPQSAKNRSNNFNSTGMPNQGKFKDEFIVTNGLMNVYNLKKKYPSNSREDFLKRK